MNRSVFALGLLSGVATWLFAAPPAFAEAPVQTAEQHENVVEFAADAVTYDTKNELITATGNVELMQEGNRILANTLTYDQKTGVVSAEGNIRLIEKSGNIVFAEKIELSDDLKDGFIQNVKALLTDDSRIAAASGKREGGAKTIFNHAVYSPCDVCADKPEKPPLWQIKAVRVVHDENKHRIKYRNAFLELWGVPIIYTPYISHADSTVQRASGLLTPKPGRSSSLGATFQLPYFIPLAQNRDITLTPMYTTAEGPVLFGEYRHHVGFGAFNAKGSITYVDQRDDLGEKTGRREIRGHLFSKGKFQMQDFANLGGLWQWRYDAQYATDDTYLRKYDITNTDTLTTDLIMERFYGRSYGIASAYHFQGLRIEDRPSLTPIALPMLSYHYVSKPGFMGSKFLVDANMMALTRTGGMDTRRVSLSGAYELPYIANTGDLFKLTTSLRVDAYQISNAENPDSVINAGRNGFTSRALPQMTLEWKHPFVSYKGSVQQTIEPLVTVVASPKGGNPASIPNEDSRSFELDDLNLFSANRFTGLDRWDGGTRVAYGVRYGVYGAQTQARILVGQVYQAERSDIFVQGTGLDGHWSDYIVGINVNFSPYLDLIHRMRIDKESFAFRRNETDVTVGPKAFKLTVGYLDINRDIEGSGADSNDLENRREIRTSARYLINDHWSTRGSYIRNLKDGGKSIYSSAGLLYEDECIQFEVSYNRRYTRDRDIEPSTSINFRIVLKHLG